MEKQSLERIDVEVMDRLIHDGTYYEPGARITLDKAMFDYLVAAGVITGIKGKAAAAASMGGPSAEELAAMVKEAIGKLEASDFDGAAGPKLAAVQKALPEGTKGVTKALVATVWAELKQP